MIEIRCKKCNALLLKVEDNHSPKKLEIVCRKCKHKNKIKT